MFVCCSFAGPNTKALCLDTTMWLLLSAVIEINERSLLITSYTFSYTQSSHSHSTYFTCIHIYS